MIRASWFGTAIFVVTAAGAAVAPSLLGAVALAVAAVLFVAGMVVFAWAYWVALNRSRTEEIAVTTLFLLAGSVPRPVRAQLFGSLAVEVVAALATAAARPFTSLAFGILVPVYGLGMGGLWASKHGTFPPRAERARPSRG